VARTSEEVQILSGVRSAARTTWVSSKSKKAIGGDSAERAGSSDASSSSTSASAPARGLQFTWDRKTKTDRGTKEASGRADVAADGTSGTAGGLPPSPGPWPFQQQTTGFAARSNGALGQPASGASFVARTVRGAFLDTKIYREVAANASLRARPGKSWTDCRVGKHWFLLLSPSLISLQGLMSLGSVAVIQLIA